MASLKERTITCENVTLAAFGTEHVPEYWRWLQDPELTTLTQTTESPSLEECHEIQKRIERDPNKYTFIVSVKGFGNVGDVNLFLDDGEPECAELDVMIAVREWRGKGIATKAVLMLIYAARRYLGINRFVAKILEDNVASVRLFEGIGFRFERKQEAFHEVVLTAGLEDIPGRKRGIFDRIRME